MAEVATIARPYAEALFKSGEPAQAKALADQVQALANVAANAQLRRYADDPKVTPAQVVDFVTAIVSERTLLSVPAHNLLRAVVDNGRLAALPEIANQFNALLDAQSGVSTATIYSAFPIDDGQLSALVETLERRFGRKLQASVVLEPELIGGVRAVVGDEVIDTSVKARLAQMKAALTAA